MGHRANLILARQDSYDLYYSHWAAATLPTELFWGPTYALEYIRSQREVDHSGWLDNVWAEGGALLDVDRKTLLLYGGHDLPYDIPLRRLYLKLMQYNWQGWRVRWAYEGICDLAGYVGYPKRDVIALVGDDELDITLDPPKKKECLQVIGSIRDEDGRVLLYPLDNNVEDYVIQGPQLLDWVDKTKGYEKIDPQEWTSDFPEGGFHIDRAKRRVDFWAAEDMAGVTERASSMWVGWEVRFLNDQYEKHHVYTEERLIFPKPDLYELLNRLQWHLLDNPSDPVACLKERLEQVAEEGKAVEVNPYALRNDSLELTESVRKTILDQAIRRFMNEKA